MPSVNAHPGHEDACVDAVGADCVGTPAPDARGSTPARDCGGSEGLRKGAGATARGQYWRSLEEFADSPEFRDIVEREFPTSATELVTPEDRRDFMKVMGASFALAGLTLAGCRRWPEQEILPYASRPQGRVPGTPVQFATGMETGGFSQGLLVTSVDGRPIKVEGNPEHPLNAGATDALAQSSILDLYDLDRSREVHGADGAASTASTASSWEAFATFARERMGALRARQGAGLAIVSEPTLSPSAARLRARFAKELPKAQFVDWEPVDCEGERAGTALVFGAPHRAQLAFSGASVGTDGGSGGGPGGTLANVVLSLDSDFLFDHPAAIRNAREFARTRRVAPDAPPASVRVSRLYMLDSGCGLTGVMADERLPMRATDVAPVAAAIAAACGAPAAAIAALAGAGSAASVLDAHGREVVELCAKDLLANRGACLVVAGRQQPAEVHALAALMNELLGNVGKTVTYTADAARPAGAAAIAGLAGAIGRPVAEGGVDTLVILDVNLAYCAPAELGFAALVKKVPVSIHLGLYRDETARLCTWHVPRAHYLETWGDGRSSDGTYTVAQPLIAPMIDPRQGGRSALELVADLLAFSSAGAAGSDGQALVRETVAAMTGMTGMTGATGSTTEAGEAGEARWRKLLHDGFLPGSAAEPAAVTLNAAAAATALNALATRLEAASAARGGGAVEIVFRPDAKVRDGRSSNNAWLQELPEPVSKIAWDNGAVMSAGTAKALGVVRGDLISLESDGRTLEIAALPLPGHPDGTISIALGYGRGPEAGRVADGAGFNAYAIRTAAAPWIAFGKATKSAGSYKLVSTQDRGAGNPVADAGIQDRLPTLVREGSLAHFKEHPEFARHPEGYHVPHRLSLWNETNLAGAKHRWAMTVDLSTCTGCNACVVACQAENNIPVVGKEQVRRGREMAWIRIDRYFRGDDPAWPEKTLFQPVTCMHCENAPCEQVCPVAATVHDEDGLNTMVYNRCVGTRYCSNNCPYKVRRFNYFDWHRMDLKRESDWIQPQSDYYIREQSNEWKRMQFNPEVTVRMRGVMEKCTFCTQRITKARIEAKNDWAKRGGRESGVSDFVIKDGAITPACAQACPSQAIVFGDLNDPRSRVSALFKSKLAYEMLEELNTKPRLRYLARVSNPAHEHGHGGHDHDHGHGHGSDHGTAGAGAHS